jgi:serine protease Do
VFAIGSPLGLDRTVSEGIISVANRVINGRLYLQTTTQINPGNSGGPLFNLKGEVVGVNNMKISAVGAEGLGFSISSNTLKSFIDNRDAYAFDPRNPNAGFRYLSPPKTK